MKVKICGIRNQHDLKVATAAGAHAVGYLVGLTHTSEGELDMFAARDLIRSVPPLFQAVLVTHFTQPREIANLSRFLDASVVQLHGELPDQAVAARTAAPVTEPQLARKAAGPAVTAANGGSDWFCRWLLAGVVHRGFRPWLFVVVEAVEDVGGPSGLVGSCGGECPQGVPVVAVDLVGQFHPLERVECPGHVLVPDACPGALDHGVAHISPPHWCVRQTGQGQGRPLGREQGLETRRLLHAASPGVADRGHRCLTKRDNKVTFLDPTMSVASTG